MVTFQVVGTLEIYFISLSASYLEKLSSIQGAKPKSVVSLFGRYLIEEQSR